jgi:hypothetical protein
VRISLLSFTCRSFPWLLSNVLRIASTALCLTSNDLCETHLYFGSNMLYLISHKSLDLICSILISYVYCLTSSESLDSLTFVLLRLTTFFSNMYLAPSLLPSPFLSPHLSAHLHSGLCLFFFCTLFSGKFFLTLLCTSLLPHFLPPSSLSLSLMMYLLIST